MNEGGGTRTVATQVLDGAQTGLTVRDSGVQVVLFSCLVDAEAFKVDVAAGAELRLHRSWDVDGALGAKFGGAVFHHGELATGLAMFE